MRKPFEKGERIYFSLQLIHYNICGLIIVRARHGASYFITFIDDFKRYGYVYLIAHKYEMISQMLLECFKRYTNLVEIKKEK